MNARPFLAGCSREELKKWCLDRGEPGFRAGQVCDWLYRHGVLAPEEMKNLPASLRDALKADFFAPGSRIAEGVPAPDGVEKLRLELWDKENIEMVLIPSPERLTFCLSTQVGCPVQCRFCASGAFGFTRNLSAGEMLEEYLIGSARAGRRPDNLVFMGIGEGLLNFEELAKTLEFLTSPGGFGMSPRRITVSTSGYLPGMAKFAELRREYSLAVSLHASDDATRARLIPDPLRFPIADILRAADHCRECTGRQYTLEYTLIDGINDLPEMGKKLGELARLHHAKVNLIPYNSTGTEFRRPPTGRIEAFEEAVRGAGARVTRRMERGAKGSAACGQLRARTLREKGNNHMGEEEK